MVTHFKQYAGLYASALTLLGLSVLLYYYPPDVIVDSIGVENSYLMVFLIAAIGGLSSVTSGVFYAAVATFTSGGAIPWLLGIIGGIGISIGDSIIFGLISYGFKDVEGQWRERIKKIRTYVDRYPSYVVYTVLFLVLGVSPLPNDIVMFALVMLGFRYLTIAPILLLAGITITTITAYLGQSLTSYLFG